LDLALKLNGQGFAGPVDRGADRHPDPALADAIFEDVGFLGPIEFDANAPLQQLLVVIGALRAERQAVGEGIGLLAVYRSYVDFALISPRSGPDIARPKPGLQ